MLGEDTLRVGSELAAVRCEFAPKVRPCSSEDRIMSRNCPKCHREHDPANTACARCGLAVARWETFRAEIPSHAALDPLWDRLVGQWDDRAAHARFVEVATHCQALAVAAARYRSACADADKHAAASEGIARLSVLAERMCTHAELAARPQLPVRLVRVVAAAVILSLVAATGLFISGANVRSHNVIVSER